MRGKGRGGGAGTIRRLAVIAVTLLGCSFSPSRTLVGEPLPDDVDYTAMLFATENGSIFAATGLLLRDQGDPVGVELPEEIEEAASVQLFGYRRSDLLEIGFTASDAATELSLATPADPVLPAPVWYGTSRVSSGRGTLERAGDPPFVTAPWLDACPASIPGSTTLVDSECHAGYCGLIATQDGCSLSIRATDQMCMPLELAGRIEGGELAIDDCDPIEPNDGAALAVLCRGLRTFECRIEVHAEASPPALQHVSFEMFTNLQAPPDDPHPAVTGGYLFGLEVFDDRIVVASDDGRTAWEGGCPSLSPGVFHFLDPETLEEIGRAPSPPCVRDLVRIPGTDEMYAVFGGEDARRLGRFDKDGTMLEEAAIPEHAGVDYPSSILLHRLSDRVSVAFDGEDTAQYFSFRRTPLAWEWTSQLLNEFVNHQEREENVLSLLQRRQDELHNIDITQPPADMRSPFYPSNVGTSLKFREVCEDIQVRMEQMMFIPGEGWLMGSRDSVTAAMLKLSLDGTDCDIIRWFEGQAEVYDFALWPANPNLVLAGIRRLDDGSAHLAFMNRSEERFLTGSLEVGFGAIDHMRPDSRGRMYMVLPWSARVVRAEAR